jgi:superfamily II DNA helicase RecQ
VFIKINHDSTERTSENMDSCQEDSSDRFRDALSKSLEKLGKGGLKVKDKQYDGLLSIVKENKDTICVLPPGYGKSLIYQLLPFMFDLYGARGEYTNGQSSSFVLVISPLTALMIDQITKLKEHVNVTVMNARTDETNRDECHSEELIYNSTSRIIFAHPEALLEDKKVFERILKSPAWKENLKAIVVDEAHLIVEWYVPYIFSNCHNLNIP